MSATTHVHEYYGIDEVLEHFAAEFESEDVTNFFLQYYAGDDGDVDSSKAKGNPEYTITVESGDERCDYYEENRYTVPLPNRAAADELADLLDGKVTKDGTVTKGSKHFIVTYAKYVHVYADSEAEALEKFCGLSREELDNTSGSGKVISCVEDKEN